jgi:signal peptidase II
MFKFLWIVAVVGIADQVTKYFALLHLRSSDIAVTPFLKFSLAFNTGAAFSFLSDAGGWQNLFFVAVAIVISIVILLMIRRLGANDMQVAVALMLVLGGALGNVIDRVRFGYVVDFIDVYYRVWHWPTFNIADSAISIGAVLLVLDALGLTWRRRSD